MSAPDATTDPELEAVAWDLSPLLDGGGDDPGAAVDAMLATAQERADSISPGSMRKPRTLTWWSTRPRHSSTPPSRHRARSPVR